MSYSFALSNDVAFHGFDAYIGESVCCMTIYRLTTNESIILYYGSMTHEASAFGNNKLNISPSF